MVELWRRVLEASGARRSMAAWLRPLKPVAYEQGRLTLRIPPGKRELAGFANPQRCADLQGFILQHVGVRVVIEIQAPAQDQGQADAGEGRTAQGQRTREAFELPTVKALREHFDVTLMNIRADYNPADNDPDDSRPPHGDGDPSTSQPGLIPLDAPPEETQDSPAPGMMDAFGDTLDPEDSDDPDDQD